MRPVDTVGLIGAGALASALVDGWVAAGFDAGRVWVCNASDDGRLAAFRLKGCHTTRDKSELARAARVLVLTVKPAHAAQAIAQLRPLCRPDHRLLSCMAGIPTAYIEDALGGRPVVVRAMPNVASGVGASATAICGGRYADPGDLEWARDLLQAVGVVAAVPEEAMDAVTAVAGSGPAYVYYLMEALAEGAAALGLHPTQARLLVLQTVAGAARLAAETEREPAELRRAVSSPDGTTVAALRVLEEAGFRGAVVAAVRRAAERSREMAEEWGRDP